MKQLLYKNNQYITEKKAPSFFKKYFPTSLFYIRFLWEVIVSAICARRNRYKGEAWVKSSWGVFKALESIGVEFDIRGVENLHLADGPVVIVGNHMSMLETTVLPLIIYPEKPLCFVIKKSLLEYPIFKHVAAARHPIAVTRTNPRADLKTIMSDGVERLSSGRSVVVFPQTTRSHSFSAKEMSTIGVKLAKKAQVCVVPLALKTDAWDNGKRLKDFGKINTTRKVYFAFGKPIKIEGKGGEEQEKICQFIETELKKWQIKS